MQNKKSQEIISFYYLNNIANNSQMEEGGCSVLASQQMQSLFLSYENFLNQIILKNWNHKSETSFLNENSKAPELFLFCKINMFFT